MTTLRCLALLAFVASAAGACGVCNPYGEVLRELADQVKQRRYLEAAQGYLEIPETITTADGFTFRCIHYPNAQANAGWCFTRVYRETKDEAYVRAARAAFREAMRSARSREDTYSASLVCYYTGLLELELGHDARALAALEGVSRTSGAPGLWIRARYQEQRIHLRAGDLRSAAACHAKIADERDPYVGHTAYALARAFWKRASALPPWRPLEQIALRERAADFAERFLEQSNAQRGLASHPERARAGLRFLRKVCKAAKREAALGVLSRLERELPARD